MSLSKFVSSANHVGAGLTENVICFVANKLIGRDNIVTVAKFAVSTLAAIGLNVYPSSALAWTSYVGTLEDWPVLSKSLEATQGEAASNHEQQYEARIRPLFVKVDNKSWEAALKSTDDKQQSPLPKAFSWDVCFGGRGEGQVTAMLDSAAKEPLPPYQLRAEDHAAWRTRRSTDFSGAIDVPVYKPILLMNSLNSSCKDPEKWKQGGAEKVRPKLGGIIAEIRKQFAFQNPDAPGYEFQDRDVKIYKSWISPKKGIYVALKLRPRDSVLETLFVSPQNEITYLGRNMLLIDASDFDGDGNTELLFKQRDIERETKRDVYVLMAGHKVIAQSIWTYP